MKPTTFEVTILSDPEVLVRIKRRVGPMAWGIVPVVLECVKDVLTKAMPPAPDPLAPKGEPVKRKPKARRRR